MAMATSEASVRLGPLDRTDGADATCNVVGDDEGCHPYLGRGKDLTASSRVKMTPRRTAGNGPVSWWARAIYGFGYGHCRLDDNLLCPHVRPRGHKSTLVWTLSPVSGHLIQIHSHGYATSTADSSSTSSSATRPPSRDGYTGPVDVNEFDASTWSDHTILIHMKFLQATASTGPWRYRARRQHNWGPRVRPPAQRRSLQGCQPGARSQSR
jgi:hypothetical protein